MRISGRIITNAIIIAFFSTIIATFFVGRLAYQETKQSLEKGARDKLVLVRDMQADSLRRYFNTVLKQTVAFSNNQMIKNAMQDFNKSFNSYEKEVTSIGTNKYSENYIYNYIEEFKTEYEDSSGGLKYDPSDKISSLNNTSKFLQYHYIFNNPNTIPNKSRLDQAADGSTYSKIHKKYHEEFRQFQQLFGFHDMALVDLETGNVVYTVLKELGFSTSLQDGPFANTEVGELFRRAKSNDSPTYAAMSDFEAYPASYHTQSAFVASGIFQNGKKIGILIIQLPVNQVNSIMTNHNNWKEIGLGRTGESYLINSDRVMMSMSRFLVQDPEKYFRDLKSQGLDEVTINRLKEKQSNIGIHQISTFGADEVAKGESGFSIYKDYRGINVLGAYEPLNVPGLNNWGIISEIDQSEAFEAVKEITKKILYNISIILFLLLLFAIVASVGMAQQISKPIKKLCEIILHISKTQDLTQRVKINSKDEIGDIANAFNKLIDSFQQAFQDTIKSTQKMKFAANRLMSLAESEHSASDETEAVQDTEDSLDELNDRLERLSRQFKIFEEEAERTKHW